MEPSHLLRWGHPVTVGMAQCDRCSCRPAQQANKTIPLICHLIPLSTGLQSQSMHNMLTIYRHLETLGLEKKSLCLWAHGILLKSQQTMLKWLPFKVADRFVILNVDVFFVWYNVHNKTYHIPSLWAVLIYIHCVHWKYPMLHSVLS